MADPCPKEMVHGPCGGVAPDGSCEVPGVRCPFVDVVRWSGGGARSTEPAPAWVLDLRPGRYPERALVASVEALADVVDFVLIGEHLDDDPVVPPRQRARWAQDHLPIPALVTVTGRGRSAAEAADEVAAVQAAHPTGGVHAVTGDHPRARFPGVEVPERFGVDCFAVIEAAAATGVTVSAAVAPDAPPVEQRVERGVDKLAAGAGMLIANHVGDPAVLTRYAERVAADAGGRPVVAPVALVHDAVSVRRLVQFPGLRLPDGDVRAVLAAEGGAGAREVAVDVAVRRAQAWRAAPGIAGVNLSGVGPDDPAERADFVREIVSRTLED